VNCPYCKQEMCKGYIWTPQQISFSDGVKSFTIHEESILKGIVTGFSVESYHCPDCKIIITPTK